MFVYVYAPSMNPKISSKSLSFFTRSQVCKISTSYKKKKTLQLTKHTGIQNDPRNYWLKNKNQNLKGECVSLVYVSVSIILDLGFDIIFKSLTENVSIPEKSLSSGMIYILTVNRTKSNIRRARKYKNLKFFFF